MYINKVLLDAGWSSLVARRAHNPKVGGSNPPPATKEKLNLTPISAMLGVAFFVGENAGVTMG